jgi:hypothetical protein
MPMPEMLFWKHDDQILLRQVKNMISLPQSLQMPRTAPLIRRYADHTQLALSSADACL